MQDRRVNVGGIGLQIREYERNAEAVIFLHFGGGNMMMWQRVVPHFQDHFRLILVDLRGHGKSDKPRWRNHIDQMARDLVGIAEIPPDRAPLLPTDSELRLRSWCPGSPCQLQDTQPHTNLLHDGSRPLM